MKQLITAVVVALLTHVAYASDMEATTLDGRQVLLKEDQTWEFTDTEASTAEEDPMVEAEVLAEEEDGTDTLELKVIRIWDLPNGCKLGLQMTNNSRVKVNSIVPRFTAIIRDGIAFETVSTSFYEIKPTISRYKEVRFSDIQCEDINEVKVHGADRCSMGELEKFSPVKGECLNRIKVVDSGMIAVGNPNEISKTDDDDKPQPVVMKPLHIKITK